MDAVRDWERYAHALDMRLEGATLKAIGRDLGVSRERARQIIELAKAQLAYRVFKGVSRPLPRPSWERSAGTPQPPAP